MQDWQLAMSVLTYILFTPHLHLQCKPLLLQRRRGRTPPRPYLNPTTSGYDHVVPIPELARKATRACRGCPVPTPQHIYSKLLGHPAPIDPDPPTPCRGVPRRWTRHRQWPRTKASGGVVVYSPAESAVTRTRRARGPSPTSPSRRRRTEVGRGPRPSRVGSLLRREPFDWSARSQPQKLMSPSC